MITLFNIGDEIEVTLRGLIKGYSASESGDFYTIALFDQKDVKVYLDSQSLANAIKRKKKVAQVMTLEEAKRLTRFTVCEFRYGISPQSISPKEIQEWIADGEYIYGKTWRCWTDMPSESQRNETPWHTQRSDILEKQLRNHTMSNGETIAQRLYEMEIGAIWCPEKCCVFCEHCSDVIYDSDGPYMFICDLNAENGRKYTDYTEFGYFGECDRFEEAEGIEEYNQKMREDREKAKELAKDPEFVEMYKKAMEKAIAKMFDESKLTDISDCNLRVRYVNVKECDECEMGGQGGGEATT